MIKDQAYIVFEHVDIPNDPVNSHTNIHVCNDLEVFSWIQQVYDEEVGGKALRIAVHEMGDCVFTSA